MKIEIIAPPVYPVPPIDAGGIERGVDDLAKGLGALGHEIGVVASADSTISHPGVRLYPSMDQSASMLGLTAETLPAYLNDAEECSFLVSQRLVLNGLAEIINLRWDNRPELLHELAKLGVPIIASISCTPRPSITDVINVDHPNITFTAHTAAHKHSLGTPEEVNKIRVLPYGIDMTAIAPSHKSLSTTPEDPELSMLRMLQDNGQDYLIHMARITPGKGQATSIQIAKEANIPLVIAGEPDPYDRVSQQYFSELIEPEIDNKHIFYYGAAGELEKIALTRFALGAMYCSGMEDRRFVEPFGRFIAEAVAAGTPVVGFDYGSLPELVQEDETGFTFRCVDEAATCIDSIRRNFDRVRCAELARKTLSADQFVSGMEELAQSLID